MSPLKQQEETMCGSHDEHPYSYTHIKALNFQFNII